MAVSLKDMESRLKVLETYPSTTQIRALVETKGRVKNAVHLNGQSLSYYRCTGCSWASGKK